MSNKPFKSASPADLERQILDPNVAKNEREWWAAREIERLRADCTVCGSDKELAKIGLMMGFRSDIILMEYRRLERSLQAIETQVDRVRHASTIAEDMIEVNKLLNMFDPESGEYIE